jgi:hypothetical protein
VYSLVNEIRDGEEKMVKSFTRIASLMALVFATQGAMALPDLGSKLKGMASKQDATEAAGPMREWRFLRQTHKRAL